MQHIGMRKAIRASEQKERETGMKRMRQMCAAALVSVGLLLHVSTPLESAAPKPYADRQVIVKLKRGLLKAEGDKIRGELRSKTKQRFKLIDAELWDISGITVEKAVEKYRNDPRIEYIEPNYTLTAFEVIPNDPSFPLLWGMHNTGQSGGLPDADIDAPEAWGIQTGAHGVIGVIDTGVDRAHPDLASNMWRNPGETAGNGIDDDGNGYVDDVHGWDFVNGDNAPMDDHGHGTHCAGTIAAIGNDGVGVAGVCWSARIMALKFLDAAGYGSTSGAVLALEYATANGARLTSNSWGGGSYSIALHGAIAAARDAGALFVAAAGNAGSDNDLYPRYPSSYDLDNIIAVAATDRHDALAGFSCYGATSVDLGAPGVEVYSCLPGDDYGTKSGTSMATPHVSGAVGLFWAEYPETPYSVVKSRMLAAVDPIPPLLGKTVSGGRLNAFRMLAEPDSIPPAALSDVAVGDTASNSVTLRWTATGDDSTSGTAAQYDVRYSTSPIDPGNFDAASQAAGEPLPLPAGSMQFFTVTGLDFNSTYYFALKVKDEWDNTSPLSNVTSAVTLDVPHIAVSPDSLADSLLTGQQSTHTLVIGNTQPHSTLDFLVSTNGVGVRAAPVKGSVPGGSSQNVTVTIDATGLYGGNYAFEIGIASNDTANSMAVVDGVLHVTGAPDVVLSDTLLDYGSVFIGGTKASTFSVENAGADTLRVSEISVDNGDFVVDQTPFVLAPATHRDLAVTFGPTAIGLETGTLTIACNDPDEGSVAVALRGVGLEPPVISVAPDSLADSLLTGEMSTHQVTISNTGASDLTWSAGTVVVNGDSMYVLAAPAAGGVDPETGEAIDAMSIRTAEISASLADLTGVRILWDRYHNEDEADSWSAILSNVESRGATVTENFEQIAPAVLAGYDLLWLTDMSAFSTSEIEAVQEWVRGGGALLFESDQAAAAINAILAGLETGLAYVATSAEPGLTTTIYPHETTMGVGSVYLSNPLAQLAVTSPGGRTVDDPAGNIVCAYSAVGGGKIFAISDEIFSNWVIGYPDNLLFGNHVVDWLTAGVSWLSGAPNSGPVPAGGSDTVDVTLDAGGMYGGNYDAKVVFSNNDPLRPEVDVPAYLHVTGAPDIAVSDTALHYGTVFIGGTKADTLSVTNDGTDTLRVSEISVDNGDYSVDTTPFLLAPEGSRRLVVTFGPTATGTIDGTLTIASDDPDEAMISVGLRGVGLEPPVIVVAPDSLADSLLTGDTSTHQVTISNTGASDLVWSAQGEGAEGADEVGADWLGVAPTAGTVPPGMSDTVDVFFDAFGMSGGDYDANVVIANNDPLRPEVYVAAHLHVTGAPDIAVPDTLVDFGVVWVGYGGAGVLEISNVGTDTLRVSGVTVSSERFGVDTSGFILAPAASRYLQLSCNAIEIGVAMGTLEIVSDDHDEDTVRVALRFEAVMPPMVRLSPASLSAALVTGGRVERELTVANDGGADLAFSIHEPEGAGWATRELRILIAWSDYVEPYVIRDSLRAFPDVEQVDMFNAKLATPSLGTLLGYDCVIIMNYQPFDDPEALGNALADYVDSGGGLIMMQSSFTTAISLPVTGRLWYQGYCPFKRSDYNYHYERHLGSYDPDHPIMAGVTSVYSNLQAHSALSSGATLVASWDDGWPFVATKGERVVGVTGTVANYYDHEWSGDFPRLLHNAAVWASDGGAICWAEETPLSGVVPAHDSTTVVVTLQAPPACAPYGSFDDTLVVTSNDPAAPHARLPLHIDVTAIPDIAVRDTLLDFGTVLIGNAPTKTFIVANYGAASLFVSSVSTDNPLFFPDVSAFSLAVNGERPVGITFEPVSPGSIQGTLSIASNDPDEPVVTVALRAQALSPPAISVSPDSLSASLTPSDTLVCTVSIGNGGVSDLNWQIYPLDGAALRTFVLPSVPRSLERPSPDENGGEGPANEPLEGAAELVATLADLAGVRVFFDNSHWSYANMAWWSTLINDLKARGATVVQNWDPITPAVLATCDVFWLTDVNMPVAAEEVIALRDWVEAGGALLLEGDQSAGAYNAILDALRAGIRYSAVGAVQGQTTQIFPHATTMDVGSAHFYYPWGHLSPVAPPARLLVRDSAGAAMGAAIASCRGRIIAIADEAFYNEYIAGGSNRLLGNQVMDWLAFGAGWLNPVPLRGTIPAGDTAAVAVTIDPRGLYGGEYDARLRILSNVPSQPEITVPAHVSMTGVPVLVLSDTALDFGNVLVGATEPRPLAVTNVGTDLLTVSKVRIAGPGYAVDSVGFTLPVHGTDTLIVTLTPPTTGVLPGLVTVYSNDAADTARTVELTGNGLVPPLIVVTPGALADTLFTGGSSSHVVTIENAGENDLVFELTENGPGNRILFIAAGADVSFVRAELLEYADVSAVDVFNGSAGTPSLEYLLSYRCVIVAGGPCADPVAVGNVLADYADRGGGVVLAFASLMAGIEVQGRIMSAGYSPFTVVAGAATSAVLGSYEAEHPIMAGIDWMQSLVCSPTTLVPGAHLVASWSGGVPAVATMGNHVVGANVFPMNEGSSPGLNTIVIARLFHNAMSWMSGGNICWMDAQPSSGTIPPHMSMQITVSFSVQNELACVTEGDYVDTLVVESNVPTMPRVNVPLHLLAIAAPDVVAADSVGDFGTVMLGSIAAETLMVANAGVHPLVVSAITSDHPSFTADPGAFSLAPSESRIVTVRFAPVDPGAVSGVLTIASNDPDEAQALAALSGYGLSNVSLVSPRGGEHWSVGEADTIRWTVSGPDPDSVTILLSRDGGASFPDTLASGIAGAISHVWVVEPPTTTEARVMIRSYRGGAVSGYDASDSLFAIVVTTDVDDGEKLPAVNTLAQNSPNPFNPVTRIDFSLRESGHVSLRVYDTAGRLVCVLIDEQMNAGRHSTLWDGRDAGGKLVASGVYYCRIAAGSFSATRKMIMLR